MAYVTAYEGVIFIEGEHPRAKNVILLKRELVALVRNLGV